jgi:hypothetical protein
VTLLLETSDGNKREFCAEHGTQVFFYVGTINAAHHAGTAETSPKMKG